MKKRWRGGKTKKPESRKEKPHEVRVEGSDCYSHPKAPGYPLIATLQVHSASVSRTRSFFPGSLSKPLREAKAHLAVFGLQRKVPPKKFPDLDTISCFPSHTLCDHQPSCTFYNAWLQCHQKISSLTLKQTRLQQQGSTRPEASCKQKPCFSTLNSSIEQCSTLSGPLMNEWVSGWSWALLNTTLASPQSGLLKGSGVIYHAG